MHGIGEKRWCLCWRHSSVYSKRNKTKNTGVSDPRSKNSFWPLLLGVLAAGLPQMHLVVPLTEEIRLKKFGSPDLDGFPVHSFEWRGLRLLKWKPAWNFGDSRENVFDTYGECRENLLEFLAVVIILSPVSSVRGLIAFSKKWYKHIQMLTYRCSHTDAHIQMRTYRCSHTDAHIQMLTYRCSHTDAHIQMLTYRCSSLIIQSMISFFDVELR